MSATSTMSMPQAGQANTSIAVVRKSGADLGILYPASVGEGLYLCHRLPVVEDALREGLARGGSAQGARESKGLNDGQVCLQVEDGGARPLCLLKDVAALLVEYRVDASQRLHAQKERLQVRIPDYRCCRS